MIEKRPRESSGKAMWMTLKIQAAGFLKLQGAVRCSGICSFSAPRSFKRQCFKIADNLQDPGSPEAPSDLSGESQRLRDERPGF